MWDPHQSSPSSIQREAHRPDWGTCPDEPDGGSCGTSQPHKILKPHQVELPLSANSKYAVALFAVALQFHPDQSRQYIQIW